MLLFSFSFYSSSKDILWYFPIKQSVTSKFGLFCICCLLKIGGDSCLEIPLSQLPPSAPPTSGTNTMKTPNCPDSPEYQSQTGDSVRHLASKVSFHLFIGFQCVGKPRSPLGLPIGSGGRAAGNLGRFSKMCTLHGWWNRLPAFSAFQVISWILPGLRKKYVKNFTSVLCVYGRLGSFTSKSGRVFSTGRCSLYLPKTKFWGGKRR